jgi:hypothetical protein
MPSPPWPHRPPEPPLPPRPRRPRPWGSIVGGLAVVAVLGATVVVAGVSVASPADDEAAGPTTTQNEDELPSYTLPLGEGEGGAEGGATTDETVPAEDLTEWDPGVADLAAFVEEARGLEFDHPIPVEFLSPEEFSAEVRGDLAPTEADRAALEDDVAHFRGFGLLPGEVDLVVVEGDLADAGILAYYDRFEDRIVIRGTEMTPDIQGTVVHELTHALQAQHFDVEAGLDGAEAETAHTGVMEGDAMRIESEWTFTLSPEEFEAYDQAVTAAFEDYAAAVAAYPAILDARGSGPYTLGPQLIDVLAADGGNGAVDGALDVPPPSTEQLLDPQAYLDRDEPLQVGEPVLPGAAREPGEPFTVGAFELYLVLATRVGPVEALDAVAGWGGDTAITYRSGQRSCVAVAAQGDTPEDDAQLRAAFEDWAAAGPANSARVADGPGNAVSLRSCQSTSEDDAAAVTTDPREALMLLDSRAFFTWQAMEIEGDGVDDALAQSDCLVRALPLETLATLVQTADPPADVEEALEGARDGCTGD